MLHLDCPVPPEVALISLVDSRYGFCLVDPGLTYDDLKALDAIQINMNRDLNEYGDLSDLEEKIGYFLSEIGPNHPLLVERIARKIDQIAKKIIAISGRESGWVCLRAAVPNEKYNLPRWHMDGHYFAGGNELQYKFALTLIGASTLFYPIPTEFTDLRQIIWIHMTNRKFMSELCQPQNVITPERGVGVFFAAGDLRKAGIHSEPPITQNRLFFSVVPCNNDQIEIVKGKVQKFYKLKSSVND